MARKHLKSVSKLSRTKLSNFIYLSQRFNNNNLFVSRFSSLVFSDSTHGDIIRYFLDKGTIDVVYNNNSSPKSLIVDSRYEVIYWIDYNPDDNTNSLMKTYFNGLTSQVKHYPGQTSSLKLAIGRDSFYVMDSTMKSIDRFDRNMSSLQDTFYLNDIPLELTVVQGKTR